MKKEIKQKSTHKMWLMIGLVATALIVMGGSYAWLQTTVRGNNSQTIIAGDLSLTIMDEKNAINLTNAYPMLDSDGLNLQAHTFILQNNGSTKLNARIKLIPDQEKITACNGCKIAPDTAIKYALTVNGGASTVGNLGAVNDLLSEVIINPGVANKITYTLKLWVDESADNSVAETSYFGKIEVTGTLIP